MKKITMIGLATICICIAAVQAQSEGGTKTVVTFHEIAGKIGEVSSSAYFDGISARKDFKLKPGELDRLRDLRDSLQELTDKLKDFSGDEKISPITLTGKNAQAFMQALSCENCVDVPSEAKVKGVKTKAELQRLLIARCNSMYRLIDKGKSDSIPLETFFALEVQLSYVREISIAFLNSIE